MKSANDAASRTIATFGLMLATLMIALDGTIANVALPHIQGSVSAGQDQITWVLTFYMLGSAIMTPLSGWLSLKIGRKLMILVSITSFVGASILCGVATSLPEIVIFRLLQGCAGAAMMPLSQAVMFDLWPPRLIPQVMSLWGVAVMVGPILGPTLGGWLTEHYSWRWVFYINVPFGALAFACIYFFMAPHRGGHERPFDAIGFFALVLCTGAIQLMVDRGTEQDWFASPEICFEAVVAFCAGWVFVMQTLTAEHPFFERAVLSNRNFLTSSLFGFFLNTVQFSTSAFLPTLMQTVLGYSALQSGMASAPRGVGSLLAFAVVPFLTARFGARPVMMIGVAAIFAALWQMGHFDLAMTAGPIEAAGFVQGFGIGLMFNPLSVLAYSTLPARCRTEATALNSVVRTMGGSLGIAVLQAMLVRQSATAHERLSAHIVPSDPMLEWSMPHLLHGVGGLEALNAEVTRQAAMIGYDAIFGWMSLASLGLAPLLLIMRGARRDRRVMLEAHAE